MHVSMSSQTLGMKREAKSSTGGLELAWLASSSSDVFLTHALKMAMAYSLSMPKKNLKPN